MGDDWFNSGVWFNEQKGFVSSPPTVAATICPSKELFIRSPTRVNSLSTLDQNGSYLKSEAFPFVTTKGKLYLSETSPVRVVEAYLSQFHKDFSLFLKSRAEEMVPGGRMVLSFTGRRDTDPNFEQSRFQYWELLALALMSLASEVGSYLSNTKLVQGLVEEEKIEELSSGQRVAKTVRAVVESMLECHFGREILDVLFRRYGEIMDDHLSRNRAMYVDLVVSLIRMG
ncbi:probable jasmonic acid carboxyl methyltransferase 2 [Rhododendron vialii]|uniref:probable jasmonic acid carboxyl methyltransferase 2 n=1 Tax=Rhododendron vialii TaxID=182163 RepID=UPI00265F3BA9|nr:probable jasmonic acid carboxyl methyltransferase 2 [Rhododendron vialii]